MEFDNILYFLLNQTAEETQEIGEEYANDLIRSGCFDKHTLSLYCGENCSRMWIDEDLKQFANLGVNVSIAGSDNQKKLSLLPMDFCFLMEKSKIQELIIKNFLILPNF